MLGAMRSDHHGGHGRHGGLGRHGRQARRRPSWPARAGGAALVVAACGRSPLDPELVGDGGSTRGTGSLPGDEDEPAPRIDMPPPELSCEAQGGRFVQVGEPWVLQSHIADYPPAYGLLPGDDAMLAMWRGPFLGTAPMPNLLGLRVSYDGAPLGPIAPVWDRPVTNEPAVHRGQGEGFVVTYCGRFDAEDRAASQVIDASGVVLVGEEERDRNGSCGAARPEGVWTGQVYLFAWVDNSSGELVTDVADATLVSTLEWPETVAEGDLSSPPRMAVGAFAVLMVAGEDDGDVRAYEFGLDGRYTMSQPIPVEPGTTSGPLAVGVDEYGSFTILLAGSEGGLWVAHRVGEEIDAPVPMDGADARYSDLLLVQRPGGLLVVAEANDDAGNTWVETIATDGFGQPTAIERVTGGEPAVFEARPAVAVAGAGAWVLYAAGYADDTFDVRLVELGCMR